MQVRLIDSDEAFLKLEKEWNDLVKQVNASFYCGFDYTRLTWKYTRSKNDRLLILLVKKDHHIVGIAPLKISINKHRHINLRTIGFINAWEGDKPGALNLENEGPFWDQIYRFLDTEFTKWDAIDLVEQAQDNKPPKKFTTTFRFNTELLPDATSYYVALDTTWEDYLASRKRKVRSNYNNRYRRLHALPGKCLFDHVSRPEDRANALERMIELEKKSWRKDTDIGVSKDKAHENFYADLVAALGEDDVSFHFLCTGSQDIAGLLLFKHGRFVYESHIAYDAEYAKFSPGIVLRAEALKRFFASSYLTYDMLGMRGIFPGHKRDWATGEVETTQILVHKLASRAFPMVIYKKLKKSDHP